MLKITRNYNYLFLNITKNNKINFINNWCVVRIPVFCCFSRLEEKNIQIMESPSNQALRYSLLFKPLNQKQLFKH